MRDSLRLISKKYTETYLNNVSKEELIYEVYSVLSDREIDRDILYDLCEQLKEQIMSDYQNSEFVDPDNWLITKTEAQICALLHL